VQRCNLLRLEDLKDPDPPLQSFDRVDPWHRRFTCRGQPCPIYASASLNPAFSNLAFRKAELGIPLCGSAHDSCGFAPGKRATLQRKYTWCGSLLRDRNLRRLRW
jgi:hypothetical protein